MGSRWRHRRAGTGRRPPRVTERARAALFDHREKRIRPGLDDKVLTGWNGMFLQTLAEAAAALGRDDWMDAARANARFLLAELAGTTAACCGHGRARSGPPPRLRRGLRRPPRGAGDAGRGRRRRLAGPGRRDRRRPVRPLRRPRRLLHHRHRRRGPHHPAPRRLRQRHPVGQLTGRQRAAAAGRPDRRDPLAGGGRGGRPGGRPDHGRAPDRLRRTPRRPRADGRGRRSRWPSSATRPTPPPPPWPAKSAAASSPRPSR